MPTQRPYNTMTIDELDIVNAQMKSEINKINEERDKLAAVRAKKVEDALYEEAMAQLERVAERDEKTVEQVALDWIDDGDRGHYIQARMYFDRKKDK